MEQAKQQIAVNENKEPELSKISSRLSMLNERLFSVVSSIYDRVNNMSPIPSEPQSGNDQNGISEDEYFVKRMHIKMDTLSEALSRLERIDKHFSTII